MNLLQLEIMAYLSRSKTCIHVNVVFQSISQIVPLVSRETFNASFTDLVVNGFLVETGKSCFTVAEEV